MGFWIFMLVMDLLIPVTMVFIGKRFQKKPPKEINAMYGYRTAMSMKNKETWKYAHRCCGKLWYVSGLVMIPVTVIVLACVFGKGNNCVGNVGGIVCTLQCVVIIGTIVVTEQELKRDLTGMGNGRGAEIIKIIHQLRKNIPGPVDDQRSEKDRPPQSGVISFQKEPEQKPKNGFCSGSSLQKHPCFAGLSFSSSP